MYLWLFKKGSKQEAYTYHHSSLVSLAMPPVPVELVHRLTAAVGWGVGWEGGRVLGREWPLPGKEH